MEEVCTLCGGSGMRLIERADGSRVAQECSCRFRKRQQRALLMANIPQKYQQESFDTYLTEDRDKKDVYTLNQAKYTAEKFVSSYPADTRGIGLLFTGTIGTGKTHLAACVLKALIVEKGATGVFYQFGDLVKKIQNSFNRNVQATESAILDPILNSDVLVLDEIGATKPSEWVFDTISHILNTRYNERRTTIVTTNYPNAEAVLVPGRVLSAIEESREALRNETLGDRIGERMRSRLQEMCMVVHMIGPDHRDLMKKARFA